MSRAKVLAAVAIFAIGVPYSAAVPVLQQDDTKQESGKQEAWQQEFDRVCSKTTDAMSLTVDELKSLLQRCVALEPRIEKLDETRRKVYSRRLKQCRGLYAYVLESKNNDKK